MMMLLSQGLLIKLNLHCLDLRLHNELSLALALVVVPEYELLEGVEWVPPSAGHRDDVARVEDFDDADAPAHFCVTCSYRGRPPP